MKTSSPSIFLLISLFASLSAAQNDSCDTSFLRTVECIENLAPALLRARALSKSVAIKPEVGAERLNPQINAQALSGGGAGSAQLNVMFPLNYGSIRSLKIQSGHLESSEVEITSEALRSKTIAQQYVNLIRVRQLSDEIRFFEVSLETLVKAKRGFSQRPMLSPQQNAELTLLSYGLRELEAKKVVSETERNSLLHDLEIQLNQKWEPSDRNLPAKRVLWPTLSRPFQIDEASSLRLEVVRKEKIKILASLSHEEKKTIFWLGPSLQIDQNAGRSAANSFGFSLSFNLPLLESYRATERLKSAEESRSVVEFETRQREIEGESEHLLELYSAATNAWSQLSNSQPEGGPSREASEPSLMKLFRQGLVPAATVLEATRQQLGYQQSIDRLEISAAMSLCELFAMKNRVKECFQ